MATRPLLVPNTLITMHIIFMPSDAFTHIVLKAHLSAHMKLSHTNHCLYHTTYIHTHKYLFQKHVGSTYLCTYTNLYTFLMATNLATINYNPLFPLQSSPPLPRDHICHTHAHLPTCTLTPQYPEHPLHALIFPISHAHIHLSLFSTNSSQLHTHAYTQPSTHPHLHTEIPPSLIYTQPAPLTHTTYSPTHKPASTFVART